MEIKESLDLSTRLGFRSKDLICLSVSTLSSYEHDVIYELLTEDEINESIVEAKQNKRQANNSKILNRTYLEKTPEKFREYVLSGTTDSIYIEDGIKIQLLISPNDAYNIIYSDFVSVFGIDMLGINEIEMIEIAKKTK